MHRSTMPIQIQGRTEFQCAVGESARVCFEAQVSFNQNGSATCFIAPESHGEPLKVYFQGRPHDSDASPLLAPSDWCVGPHLGNRNAGESSSRDKTTYFLVGGSRNNHGPLDSLARHSQTAGIGS